MKYLASILVTILFCFVCYLWIFELEANEQLKARIDACYKVKKCGIYIEEPTGIIKN